MADRPTITDKTTNGGHEGHDASVGIYGRLRRRPPRGRRRGGRNPAHAPHIPPWFARPSAGIFEYELAACLLGLILAAFYAPGRPVLVCCDNLGARGAVVRGSCTAAIGRMLSAAFWNVAAVFSCAVWIDFVASALNVADPPSRACELIPLEERPNGTTEGAPHLFQHIMSSRHSLASAQFKIDTQNSKMTNGWSCPVRHTKTAPSKQRIDNTCTACKYDEDTLRPIAYYTSKHTPLPPNESVTHGPTNNAFLVLGRNSQGKHDVSSNEQVAK